MLLNQVVIGILFGVIFFWLAIVSVLLVKFLRHYQNLTKGITKKDLKSVLEKVLKDLKGESGRIDQVLKEVEKIKQEEVFFIQKIGLVRYNPFAETGGNQSFCLSILDGQESGLVITSLHSRDATRLYAKPVKNGKAGDFELSSEEKKAIKAAKKIK